MDRRQLHRQVIHTQIHRYTHTHPHTQAYIDMSNLDGSLSTSIAIRHTHHTHTHTHTSHLTPTHTGLYCNEQSRRQSQYLHCNKFPLQRAHRPEGVTRESIWNCVSKKSALLPRNSCMDFVPSLQNQYGVCLRMGVLCLLHATSVTTVSTCM